MEQVISDKIKRFATALRQKSNAEDGILNARMKLKSTFEQTQQPSPKPLRVQTAWVNTQKLAMKNSYKMLGMRKLS